MRRVRIWAITAESIDDDTVFTLQSNYRQGRTDEAFTLLVLNTFAGFRTRQRLEQQEKQRQPPRRGSGSSVWHPRRPSRKRIQPKKVSFDCSSCCIYNTSLTRPAGSSQSPYCLLSYCSWFRQVGRSVGRSSSWMFCRPRTHVKSGRRQRQQ
jgi:hypothetical protein